ncbi:MAG: hypothetical protein IJ079_01760 [Lachnospiraceae bacterium]|nr:hypothetical protein [Lachnospiraceae bacterium]
MFQDYISINFTTLMILLVLGVTMFTNRKHRVPSTRLYYVLVILLFVITILEYFDNLGSEKITHTPPFGQSNLIQMRLLSATAIYILRPFIILLELIVIRPGRKRAIILSIPAIINAMHCSTYHLPLERSSSSGLTRITIGRLQNSITLFI